VSIKTIDLPVTVALLHLAPRPGKIAWNKRMVERAVLRAAAMGARFIVASELVISGYGFRDVIGTDWIGRDQEALFGWARELARQASAFLLLGMPEAAPPGKALFNSLLLFSPDGSRVGHHRKVNVLRVGSESWSAPGDRATVIAVDGIGRVGLFVCADMYSRRLVEETISRDVDLLLSAAAWAPGEHGPNGEWEWASVAATRPVLVCNRTGSDVLDFSRAQSIAAVGGVIVHVHASPEPAVVLVDWTLRTHELTNWRAVAVADQRLATRSVAAAVKAAGGDAD
jgi:predicted amidohydrolase